MSRLDMTRVAEILVRRGHHVAYGSGYRISTALILTVGHLVDSPSGKDSGTGEVPSLTVLLGCEDPELSATLVWRSPRQDLAVLELDDPPDAVEPVVLGRLPDVPGRVQVEGIGFPAFVQRPASKRLKGLRRRDSKLVTGFVEIGSNMKWGLLDLTITSARPVDSRSQYDSRPSQVVAEVMACWICSPVSLLSANTEPRTRAASGRPA